MIGDKKNGTADNRGMWDPGDLSTSEMESILVESRQGPKIPQVPSSPKDQDRSGFDVTVVEAAGGGGRLRKHLSYDSASGAIKHAEPPYLSRGQVKVQSFQALSDFMAFRTNLDGNQALIMGEPLTAPAKVVTKATLASIPREQRSHKEIIARDREHFRWPAGPTLVMLDIDRPEEAPESVSELLPDDPEGIRDLVVELIPGVAQAPMAWATSSSSCLFVRGEEVRGISGQRLYVLLESGHDVDRFAEALRVGLTNRGLIWCKLSKSGQRMIRYPVDFAVFRPEHLDFAAKPACAGGLESRPPTPIVWENDAPALPGESIPTPSPTELARAKSIIEARKRDKLAESERVRLEFRSEVSERFARAGNVDVSTHGDLIDAALDRDILLAGWVLTDKDGVTVTVGELLEDPSGNHGRELCDPLEPDYRNDTRIAVFLYGEDGKGRIYSHAHGGRTWLCLDRLSVIPVGTTDETFDAIRHALVEDRCGLYRKGGSLVAVNEVDGTLYRLSTEGLAYRLQKRFSVVKHFKNGPRPADLPTRVLNTVIAESHRLPIPELKAVAHGPFLRADGSVVDSPGFDPDSGVLYLARHPGTAQVNREPSEAELRRALDVVLRPLEEVRFASGLDRSVVLTAIFAGVARPSMRKAPAYMITAPTQGSGKTTLGEFLGALQTGHSVPISSMPEREEELRKKMFAALMVGTDFLFLDNIGRGSGLQSPILANYLTSESITDRPLGESRMETHPNRMTLVFTGNNVASASDLTRRIATIRLDRKMERPWEERYKNPHPADQILEDFANYRAAILTVYCGFVTAGAPMPEDRSGFPDWDRLCRAVVVWIGNTLAPALEIEDPIEAFRDAYADDREAGDLTRLTAAIYEVFESEAVLAREILELSDREFGQHFNPQAGDDEGLSEAEHALVDCVDELIPRGKERRAAALGRYLKKHEGRVTEGLQLVRAGERNNTALWRIQPVGPQES